jgi:hypothetical protein
MTYLDPPYRCLTLDLDDRRVLLETLERLDMIGDARLEVVARLDRLNFIDTFALAAHSVRYL